MSKKKDLLVFIGRFQPFHNGHKAIIDRALEEAENVLILVGSSGRSRTLRNPWTFEERADMISGAYGYDWLNYNHEQIIIEPIYDKTYNDNAWVVQIQDVVQSVAIDIANRGSTFQSSGWSDLDIGLIGHQKDGSSYYLNLFPQWKKNSINVEDIVPLDATSVREMIFNQKWQGYQLDAIMPHNVVKFVFEDFPKTEIYNRLISDYNYVKKEKKSWSVSPYPPTFNTVDNIVVQSGHILLVERGPGFGEGLLAIPGGYLEQKETLLDGAIRELREETGLKVPEKVLRGSIKSQKTFDDPYRSDRGRLITHAFYYKLDDDNELPRVKGSSDARKAFWVPISELNEENMFEDHYHIIHSMLGIDYV